jgi:ankyrin repeat protein
MRLTKLLVSRGASIHIGNPPPLVAAVVMQCPTIVKYLLTLGADVNCKDRVTGTTPLYAALINVTPKMNDVLDILLTFSDKHDPNVTPPNMTPLIFRALSSYQTTGTIVKAILALPNIDVNIRCPKTNSYPIHNTIWGNSNLEQLLACPGLDVNIKDGDGNTALHLAARSGALGISLLLAHPGIDFLVENSEGRTALQIAELDAPYIVHEFHEAIAKRTK